MVVDSDVQQFFVPLSYAKDWKSNGKEFLQIILIPEGFTGFFISLVVYCGEFLRKGDFGCWDQYRSTGNLEWVELCYWGRPPLVEEVLEDSGLALSQIFIERGVGWVVLPWEEGRWEE